MWSWPDLAVAVALAFSVLLPVVELARIGLFSATSDLWLALLATTVFLPLHLRHVSYGLRDERAPGADWTLGAIFVVMIAAGLAIGGEWALMLASLVLSILLIVRAPWSLLLVGVFWPSPFSSA